VPGLSVDGALALLKDAIRRNASATCPTCGHQHASLRVSDSIEDLTDAIRREQEREAALLRAVVPSNIGTAS
jgi:hypothetical protein